MIIVGCLTDVVGFRIFYGKPSQSHSVTCFQNSNSKKFEFLQKQNKQDSFKKEV